MGIKILVRPGGQSSGFLISVAQVLSRQNDVVIVTGPKMKKAIQGVAPELVDKIAVRSNFTAQIGAEDIIEECRKREKSYGETFSMISSHDRGLGKGYMFNADRHPDIARSWWGHEDKLKVMLEEFLYYEHITSEYSPGAIISGGNTKIASLVAERNNIRTLAIAPAKYGDRYLWVENEQLFNTHLSEALRGFLEHPPNDNDTSASDYQQITASLAMHGRINYSYRAALKSSARRIARHLYHVARATASRLYRRRWTTIGRRGYRSLGWLGPTLRKPYSYRYFQKHGVRPDELSDYTIVYYPLHMEPEVALLAVSPEFNNSMEAIAWVSKSLPADAVLVVKEQPVSFGIRSKHYYDNLRRIGNVKLAHPSAHPWEWIKAARVVSTITGTAGIEAVHFGKPVLSFGNHQIINDLPTVRYANSYESTRQSMQELMALDPDDRSFVLSKNALNRAQLEASFELPGFEDPDRFAEPKPDLARVAVAKLYEQYPDVFEKS